MRVSLRSGCPTVNGTTNWNELGGRGGLQVLSHEAESEDSGQQKSFQPTAESVEWKEGGSKLVLGGSEGWNPNHLWKALGRLILSECPEMEASA